MRSRQPIALALAGVLLAGAPMAYLWGFTVDDALITARYASHLAEGAGYRFNLRGPATDGVTPLGWAHVLSLFAHDGPLSALLAARVIGVVAWLVAAAFLGRAVDRAAGARRFGRAALLLLVTSAPLAAWAVSGMETGVVTALVTGAALIPAENGRGGETRGALGALLAGMAAGLRPELAGLSAVLGLGRARAAVSTRGRLLMGAGALGPFLGAACVRLAVWGRPAPLAVLAKPSDLAHGLVYAGACALLTGGPLAALSPGAWRRLPRWPRWLLAAAFAHFVLVACAGGDWMPLSRLVVPALPLLVLVVAHLATVESAPVWGARLAVALVGPVYAFATVGPRARTVLRDRMTLIETARGPLADARLVATVDVGWVGAATRGDVMDLAGATDAEIAALPGGHTSKAVSGTYLGQRGADTLVFLVAPEPRAVERRLLGRPGGAGPLQDCLADPTRGTDPLRDLHALTAVIGFRFSWKPGQGARFFFAVARGCDLAAEVLVEGPSP